MNKKILVATLVVLVLGVGGFFILNSNQAEAPKDTQQIIVDENGETNNEEVTEEENNVVVPPTNEEKSEEETTPPPPPPSTQPKEATVTYTSSGYSLSTLTVSAGTKVTFINQSAGGMWTASAIHPTHTVYPGTNIANCGTGAIMFDACVGTPPGSSWSFTFNSIGSWNYHNHLRPNHSGKIIVQ